MIDLITQFDRRFILWIHRSIRLKRVDPLLNLISILGSSVFTFPFTLLCLFINFKLGIELFLSLALCFFSVQLSKSMLHRWRPYHGIEGVKEYGKREIESSFPSGHTSAAFAMAVCLQPYMHTPFLLYVLAAIVGYTRIQLGHHYPSDVIGGAVVGVALSLVVGRLGDWIGLMG